MPLWFLNSAVEPSYKRPPNKGHFSMKDRQLGHKWCLLYRDFTEFRCTHVPLCASEDASTLEGEDALVSCYLSGSTVFLSVLRILCGRAGLVHVCSLLHFLLINH